MFNMMNGVHYISLQTSEKEQIEREQGKEKAKDASDVIEYKIDIPANR